MPTPNSIDTIRRLCTLGARPPIILSFFRNIPLKTIRAIYRETTNSRPIKGQLPVAIKLYFDPKYAVQASLLAKIYVDAIQSGVGEADALIKAFEMLRSYYGADTNLNFSQAWHITRYVELGQFVLKRCTDGHTFLHNRDNMLRKKAPCPVCREIAKVKSAMKRNKISSFSGAAKREKSAKMYA